MAIILDVKSITWDADGYAEEDIPPSSGLLLLGAQG